MLIEIEFKSFLNLKYIAHTGCPILICIWEYLEKYASDRKKKHVSNIYERVIQWYQSRPSTPTRARGDGGKFEILNSNPYFLL